MPATVRGRAYNRSNIGRENGCCQSDFACFGRPVPAGDSFFADRSDGSGGPKRGDRPPFGESFRRISARSAAGGTKC